MIIATWSVNGDPRPRDRGRGVDRARASDRTWSASAPLGRCATSCVVQADYGTSDHAPVIARFADAG
jgi:exonuclease III